jgi:hypothetical protein
VTFSAKRGYATLHKHANPTDPDIIALATARVLNCSCPEKGTNYEGGVTKELSIAPAGGEGDGYVFRLSEDVKSRSVRTEVSVQLTPAEFYVVKNLAEYAIPYLLGFDLVLNKRP